MNTPFHSMPLFKRGRGYRLYDYKGNTYLDFYQNGGHALLGHGGKRITTVIKNVISKGILTDLPSIYTGRLEKLLVQTFCGFLSVRIVYSMERALELASIYLGRKVKSSEAYDPALTTQGGKDAEISYWRPLIPGEARETEVLIPILPFSMGHTPQAVCFRKSPPPDFPKSDPISPVILAGALRSLYNLKKHRMPAWFREDLLKGCPAWIQRGIYIVPDFGPEAYRKVFTGFLKGGLILSPHYPGPSIFPAELSEGEFKKMIKLFKLIPGE